MRDGVPQQIRLVVESDDAEFLKKIAQVTRCGSASKALSILISRCGNLFLNSWELSPNQQPAQLPSTPEPSLPPFSQQAIPQTGEDLAPLDF